MQKTVFAKAQSCFFNRDFDALSLIDLIRDSATREVLAKAQEYLSRKLFNDCISQCALAERYLASSIELVIPKLNTSRLSTRRLFERDKQWDANMVFEQITEQFDALRDATIATLLGLKGAAYLKYRGLMPSIHEMMGGSLTIVPKEAQYSEEEASFCMTYTVSFGLKMQNLVGSK
jgi:hypothetical protein